MQRVLLCLLVACGGGSGTTPGDGNPGGDGGPDVGNASIARACALAVSCSDGPFTFGVNPGQCVVGVTNALITGLPSDIFRCGGARDCAEFDACFEGTHGEDYCDANPGQTCDGNTAVTCANGNTLRVQPCTGPDATCVEVGASAYCTTGPVCTGVQMSSCSADGEAGLFCNADTNPPIASACPPATHCDTFSVGPGPEGVDCLPDDLPACTTLGATRCDGTFAAICTDKGEVRRDCSKGVVACQAGVCAPPECGIDPLGDGTPNWQCDGDALVGCRGGTPIRFECAEIGRTTCGVLGGPDFPRCI